jgi:hypothetical protein
MLKFHVSSPKRGSSYNATKNSTSWMEGYTENKSRRTNKCLNNEMTNDLRTSSPATLNGREIIQKVRNDHDNSGIYYSRHREDGLSETDTFLDESNKPALERMTYNVVKYCKHYFICC